MKKTNSLVHATAILCFALFINSPLNAQKVAVTHDSVESLEGSLEPPESELNTASARIDGKELKLTLIGDQIPKLYIEGTRVPNRQLEMYADAIDRLSSIILDRQIKENELINAATVKTKKQILTELVDRGFLPLEAPIKSFYLCSTYMKVNGVLQDQKTFNYFKSRFIKSEDKAFYYEK